MGYTHYWTQTRDFTREEWSQIVEDFEALLKDVQHVQGIPLANGMGEPRTTPRDHGRQSLFQRRRRRRPRDHLPKPETAAEGIVAVQSRRRFLQDGPEAL
jgi:hypothetical protein